MSTAGDLPLWVRDREEVLKNDDGVEWRNGKRPNYSMTNAHLEKEKGVAELKHESLGNGNIGKSQIVNQQSN